MNIPRTNSERGRGRALQFVLLLAGLLAWSGCATSRDPRPRIYNASVDGGRQLETSLAKARRADKLVLLNLGANWCSDSQQMYRVLREHPEVRREVARHYVLAMVDVNDRNGPRRNAGLLDRFPAALSNGIPALLVIAPDGTWLNSETAERLMDKDHAEPGKVAAYLRKWAAAAATLRESKPAGR